MKMCRKTTPIEERQRRSGWNTHTHKTVYNWIEANYLEWCSSPCSDRFWSGWIQFEHMHSTQNCSAIKILDKHEMESSLLNVHHSHLDGAFQLQPIPVFRNRFDNCRNFVFTIFSCVSKNLMLCLLSIIPLSTAEHMLICYRCNESHTKCDKSSSHFDFITCCRW